MVDQLVMNEYYETFKQKNLFKKKVPIIELIFFDLIENMQKMKEDIKQNTTIQQTLFSLVVKRFLFRQNFILVKLYMNQIKYI